MIMVDIATGGLYVTGTLAPALALLVLSRWFLGLRGRLPRLPRYALAAALAALLLGSVAISEVIAIELGEARSRNTRTFTYWVTVHLNGTVSARLLLPAPLDARVYPALNKTVGTSTLRLNQTGAQPSVEIVATENVSFEAHIEFVGDPISTELSRVSSVNDLWDVNASVALFGAGSGSSSAWVQLIINIGDYCESVGFILDAVIHEGIADYPASRGRSVC